MAADGEADFPVAAGAAGGTSHPPHLHHRVVPPSHFALASSGALCKEQLARAPLCCSAPGLGEELGGIWQVKCWQLFRLT